MQQKAQLLDTAAAAKQDVTERIAKDREKYDELISKPGNSPTVGSNNAVHFHGLGQLTLKSI